MCADWCRHDILSSDIRPAATSHIGNVHTNLSPSLALNMFSSEYQRGVIKSGNVANSYTPEVSKCNPFETTSRPRTE